VQGMYRKGTVHGVLLLGFGGFGAPRSLDEVEPFLTSLLGKGRVTPGILRKAIKGYRAIGGGSPLPYITEKQARGLQKALGNKIKVGLGFLHSKPHIFETMKGFKEEGIRRVLGVSLSPHASRFSTWAYKKEAEESAEKLGVEFKLSRSWHTHPLYISALVEKYKESLKKKNGHLLFTAHSIPLDDDKDAWRYSGWVMSTIKKFIKAVEGKPYRPGMWSLAFQSGGTGRAKWLGPSVEEALKSLSAQGVRAVLVMPLSFVSDNLEILYDLDIISRAKAESLNMKFRRVEALNNSQSFINLLSTIVKENIHAVQ